jgi:cyclopropane fatty-acyl-phospholipid synthase-like methyltransferase
VLDIAAGAGSHALHLQHLGLDVTAADFSAGAREVCRARGCRKVMSIDLRDLRLESAAYGSIIVMGNTIGAHQTLATFPTLLERLRAAVRAHGRLLFTMIDPTDTNDASHLDYQRRNRERGHPTGFVRMRVRYQDINDDWMDLLMLTEDELRQATSDAGWTLIDNRRRGPWLAQLYENVAS